MEVLEALSAYYVLKQQECEEHDPILPYLQWLIAKRAAEHFCQETSGTRRSASTTERWRASSPSARPAFSQNRSTGRILTLASTCDG